MVLDSATCILAFVNGNAARFPHADQVGRRTVFNIAGNHYRLIARINYRGQKLYVLAVLTHAEYDKEQWK